ncbi:hypothetical protein ACQP2F_36075 [Actinoplanes sp. CA-030573]|uniref:hypothetical protein n=1 Tax=Actinoplanes sp. CA-030573 TaxID=3239898 RepID=UPI003D91CA90
MGEITSIDVPAVTAMAGAVREVAGRLEQISRTVGAFPEPAVEGSTTCADGIPEAAYRWRGALGRLADDLTGFGDGLRRAAADYHQADIEAEERVRASGHPAFGTYR